MMAARLAATICVLARHTQAQILTETDYTNAKINASVPFIECDVCREFSRAAWQRCNGLDENGIEAEVGKLCGPNNQIPADALLYDIEFDHDAQTAAMVPTKSSVQILRMDWQSTAMKTACVRTLGSVELELAEAIYEGRSKREHSKKLLEKAVIRMQNSICKFFCIDADVLMDKKAKKSKTSPSPPYGDEDPDVAAAEAQLKAAEVQLKIAQGLLEVAKAKKGKKGKNEKKEKKGEKSTTAEPEAREQKLLKKKKGGVEKKDKSRLDRARSGVDSQENSLTPEQQMRAAMEADDAKGIQVALDRGADINHHDDGVNGGQTTLMTAVLGRKNLAIQYLVDQGADCTIGESSGYTPMHGAGFKGNPEAVHILFEAGCDPSEMGTDGFTPIHRACWGGEQEHTATVKAFLEVGVPHDELATDGRTPSEMYLRNQLDVPNAGTKELLDKWIARVLDKQEL